MSTPRLSIGAARWAWALCLLGACATRVAKPSLPAVVVRHSPILTSVGQQLAVISFTLEANAKIEVKSPGIVTKVATLWPAAYTGFDRDLIHYEVTLAGLTPGTAVTYEVLANGQPIAPPATFKTAPSDPTQEVRVAVIGDSGTGSPEQKSVAEWLARNPFDLSLHTGDLAYRLGTFGNIEQKVLSFYAAWWASVPFFPSPGNHDYYAQSLLPYLAVFALPENAAEKGDRERYYAFTWGPVRFYALDSNAPLDDGVAMTRWLEEDLKATEALFRVAYFHHPPYSSSSHGDDDRVQSRLVPIFEANRVDLVLSGHDHAYERTKPLIAGVPSMYGIPYIVTGGGGAQLYGRNSTLPRTEVFAAEHHALELVFTKGCKLSARAVKPNDEVIDTFTIDKCQVAREPGQDEPEKQQQDIK